MHQRPLSATLALAALLACGEAPVQEEATRASETLAGAGEHALAVTLERSHALAKAVADTLKPVPLIRPAQENALRRFDNAAQLRRGRQLGIASGAPVEALVAEGSLVQLEDSTRWWVVRELDASAPYVTPDAYALLEEIGRRFQARMEAMGLPLFRIEITSALRTAADQAALRRTNPNAAAGTSTHELGTTVDVAYTSFPAPAATPDGLVPEDAGESRPLLEAVAALALDAAAARKSRELQAILAEVLQELQDEGAVMVTLERLQPVFHMTVARRMAEG
ncbi:MAG TPA: DUF5715 family protein [Longimicrobiales bacterium]|nr:DUF5715 family protein [Longimicrobiales bacterium]